MFMSEIKSRYLLFSVDVEPDALHWKGHYRENQTCKNQEDLPLLIELVKKFGVKPTFFITHSMALERSIDRLMEPMLKNNFCEVGAHFHPGETPPFQKSKIKMLDNILSVPDELLNAKFERLFSVLTPRFGSPRSYRAGAWTIDSRTIALLERHGFTIDSSVTPQVSWRLINRPSYLRAPQSAYYLDPFDPCKRGFSKILEIPVSIWSPRQIRGVFGEIFAAVFSMPLESRSGYIVRCIKAMRPYKPLWLRPAIFSIGEMIETAEKILQTENYVHIMCHSNELSVGASPYSKTPEQRDVIVARLKQFFAYARQNGLIPMTLSEYAADSAG